MFTSLNLCVPIGQFFNFVLYLNVCKTWFHNTTAFCLDGFFYIFLLKWKFLKNVFYVTILGTASESQIYFLTCAVLFLKIR
jgi:hypothetical protein